MFHIVLVHPEIPPNTGNIARTCAATACHLHLIEPLGFELSDRYLKRGGMDYWKHLEWTVWPDWNAFVQAEETPKNLWYVESDGPTRYDQAPFQPGDGLVFGCETKGLPPKMVRDAKDRWVRIPMIHPTSRSLNLSNSVALVLYEALRQQGFSDERPVVPETQLPANGADS